jgi:hypothetical protein
MEGLELLEKYPLTAKVVKDWFMERMLESFKDDTVPEGFKNYMLEQGIENDKVAKMIDANPRMLLDVFDENEIYIQIGVNRDSNLYFQYKLNDFLIGNFFRDLKYKTRKEAELFAVEAAFEILENNLTPKEETNENE